MSYTDNKDQIKSSFRSSKLLTMELESLRTVGYRHLSLTGRCSSLASRESDGGLEDLRCAVNSTELPLVSHLWSSRIRSMMGTDQEGRGRRKSKGLKGRDHHF